MSLGYKEIFRVMDIFRREFVSGLKHCVADVHAAGFAMKIGGLRPFGLFPVQRTIEKKDLLL